MNQMPNIKNIILNIKKLTAELLIEIINIFDENLYLAW